MKKTILFISFILLFSAHTLAQDLESDNIIGLLERETIEKPSKLERKFFKIGLWPKASTGGTNYKGQTNSITFNLMGGQSYNEFGFSFNTFFGEIYNKARGVHISGFAQRIYYKGEGLSIALLYNIAKDYDGVMLNLGFGSAEQIRGMQIGGFNGSVYMQGVQLGFGNYAKEVKGMQIGFINFTKELKGLQIGILNTRDKTGAQFGVFNMSDDNDYSIGFINIVKNGRMDISVEVDELTSTTFNYRSGGRVMYGLIGAGYNFKSDYHHYALQVGWGIHIPISKRFEINTELLMSWLAKPNSQVLETVKKEEGGNLRMVSRADENSSTKRPLRRRYEFYSLFRPSLRILPSYQINNQFTIFAGPSISYMQTNTLGNAHMYPSHSLWKKVNKNRRKQLYIGYTSGIRYRLK